MRENPLGAFEASEKRTSKKIKKLLTNRTDCDKMSELLLKKQRSKNKEP